MFYGNFNKNKENWWFTDILVVCRKIKKTGVEILINTLIL